MWKRLVSALATVTALAGVGAGVFGGASAAAASSSSEGSSSASSGVIVVGAPGLLWSDISAWRTPNLWAIAGKSSLGSLSVKAANPVSCADDGWLTLGAGNRADSRSCDQRKLTVLPRRDGGADVAGFAPVASHNEKSSDHTHLGALADAVQAAGGCVSAIGDGAALAASDSRGQVASFRADLSAAGDPAFLRRCSVTVVAASSSGIDGVVGAITHAMPPDATLLVVGVSDVGKSAHLQVAIARGAAFGVGALDSASTRRAPFVQLVDVAPTILWLRGIDSPSSMIGQPWRHAGARDVPLAHHVSRLDRLDLAAQQQSRAVIPFWVGLVALNVAALAFAWWVANRRRGDDQAARRLRRIATVGCVWVGCLPAASFLAGVIAWWAAPLPVLVLAGATIIAAAALAGVAIGLMTVVWLRRPVGLAAGAGAATFGVIALDLVSGAHLQILTMAGYSPLVAGRFAGIGNVAFGIYAAGALLAVAGIAAVRVLERRAALAALAVVAAVAVVVDGAPPWGSDVGGVLALVPAFVLLGWLVSGARVSWRLVAAGAGLAVFVVVAFALLDYSRPAAKQTHLGRFVGDVLHGGAWSIVARKAGADVHLLTYSVLTLLIPLLVIVGIWLLRRPPRALARAFVEAPALRAALVCVVVMSVIGALVNDSGVVIPALAALVVLPATLAAVVASSPTRTADQLSPTEPKDEASAC